jgi:hypothetical protein
MPSNCRNLLLLTAVLSLITAPLAEAQGPVGTRAAGLAGAFVGLADDASAVYWNPAGLATGAIVSAVVMFGAEETAPDWPQPNAAQRHTALLTAVSAPPIGLAYYRLGAYGSGEAEPAVITVPSREEVRRSVQAVTTSVLGVSLLHSLNEYIVVGVTPKYVSGTVVRGVTDVRDAHDALNAAADLDGDADAEFDVDAGVMVAVQRLRLGLVARNLTTPEFRVSGSDGEVVELGTEVRVGAAWGSGWPGRTRVIVAFDGDLKSRPTPLGDRRDIAGGVETWWLGQRVGVRGGWRRSTIGEARSAVAGGISAGLKAGFLIEAHVVAGDDSERGWSVGARFGF